MQCNLCKKKRGKEEGGHVQKSGRSDSIFPWGLGVMETKGCIKKPKGHWKKKKRSPCATLPPYYMKMCRFHSAGKRLKRDRQVLESKGACY